jgi:chaperonin GroES
MQNAVIPPDNDTRPTRPRIDFDFFSKENNMIRPLYDRIIVKRATAETKTASGIIIPDTAKEKPQEGEIIAVGKGKLKEDGTVIPMDVKKGDRILFGKYAGTEIKIDGEEYLMMKEDDVLGIID